MSDFSDKLNNFAQRLKEQENTAPIQEVKPRKNSRSEKIVRATVHLPESLHQQMKIYCAQKQISVKDFVTNTLSQKLKNAQ